MVAEQPTRLVALIVICSVTLIAAVMIWAGPLSRPVIETAPSVTATDAPTPTETPDMRTAGPPGTPFAVSGDFPDPMLYPLYTSTDAISRTLQFAPKSSDYYGALARLVTREDLRVGWYDGEASLSDDLPTSPLWMVGVLGTNLVVSDTLRLPTGHSLSTDATPVDGLYVLWDANSGELRSNGPLGSSRSYSYEMLQALPNRDLEVTHATALPGLYLLTPTP